MNFEPKKISPRDLERLVDGQLSHDDYRRVVENLEQDPDGWRRCCLAFLEQQALRADLTDCDLLSIDEDGKPRVGNDRDPTQTFMETEVDWSTPAQRIGLGFGHWIKNPLWALSVVVAASVVVFFAANVFRTGPSNTYPPVGAGAFSDGPDGPSLVSNPRTDPDRAPNLHPRTNAANFAVLRIDDPQADDTAIVRVPLRWANAVATSDATQDRGASKTVAPPSSSVDVRSVLSKVPKPTRLEDRILPTMTPDGQLLLVRLKVVHVKSYQ